MEAWWPDHLGGYHEQSPSQKHWSQQTRGPTVGEQEVTVIFLFLYDLHQFQGRGCPAEPDSRAVVRLEWPLRNNWGRQERNVGFSLAIPVLTEGLSGSWKEGAPSSSSSSGYWSWSAPSDQSNPSTPSPPLSADSFKPFRSPVPLDDGIDEAEASNLLFDEPIPRKRKVGGLCTMFCTHSPGVSLTPHLALAAPDFVSLPI